jgi:hypothetical protein
MMACAIDEGVRNAVAVAATSATWPALDNFCWCDPVQSEKTPDGEYKLAQLVRANQALDPLLPRLRRALHLRQGQHEERLHGRRHQDLHPAHGALLGHGRDRRLHQDHDLRLQGLQGQVVIDEPLAGFKAAWQATLKF